MEQAPYTSPVSPPPSPKPSSAGPVIGTIIVISLLALGALYFWGARLNGVPEELPLIPGDDASAESWAPQQSSSDEAAAIEADLNATNMTEFEQQMDADLNATESSL